MKLLRRLALITVLTHSGWTSVGAQTNSDLPMPLSQAFAGNNAAALLSGNVISDSGIPLDTRIAYQTEHLELLLSERGVFGEGTAEAYAALGKLHAESGDFEESAKLSRQAWHVDRMNSGLYSESQLKYLIPLIESLEELGQWEEVQALHHLRFVIARKVFQPQEQQFIAAADFYTTWQWQSISENLFENSFEVILQKALDLSASYEEIIDAAQSADTPHLLELAHLIQGKAQTDVSIARALTRYQAVRSTAYQSRFSTQGQCAHGYPKPNSPVLNCQLSNTPSQIFNSFPSTASYFTLHRSVAEISSAISRLERVKADASAQGAPEIVWIDSLIAVLDRETQSLLRAEGRI